jgi:hypothetical protein
MAPLYFLRFRLLQSLAGAVSLATGLPVSAAAAEPDVQFPLQPGEVELAPSFEACSYYFRPRGAAERAYLVEFRRLGDATWRRAFEPVSDRPAGIWKGSLFNLEEDAAWQMRVLAPGGAEVVPPVDFRTWSGRPPIARTVDLRTLPATGGGLVISEQGAPDGWIKYTAPRGWRMERAYDARDPLPAAITFRQARYVILEGVTIVGGARHGVLVEESESVRIINCDISGWGRIGEQRFSNTGTRGMYFDGKGEAINRDAGVEINRSARTVVERCYIHDPRGRANSWMFAHPAGPMAVHVYYARGGTVVRWNDFVGSDEHRWNDVIESSSNSAPTGGFFRDADISGNFLAFGNDDGVELEGGGMNVRFHRNKIEGTVCSISTGACILGPQFIYGNLVANPGDEAGLALWFFKNSHGAEQGGKRHFVGNTLTGAVPGAYGGYGKPAGSGRIGFMRNNVFVCSAARLPGEWARRDDFDHDLFWAGGGADAAGAFLAFLRALNQERNGVAADPRFVAPEQGDFHLRADSPARGKAAAVANLATAGADLGAFGDEAAEVPFRPLALTAAPRQLDFGVPQKSVRREVRLSVPANAREPVPFEIRQNRAFTWFRVEPAAGQVAPGETRTLTVMIDPAALRGRPRFRGAFLVRTPSGLSRPVSVYASVDFREDLRPASAPNSFYFPAAAFPGAEKLVRETASPGVFGGKYVALTGTGTDPELPLRFVVTRAGAYSVLVRAGPGPDVMRRRSFSLALDGAAPTTVSINSDYQWNVDAAHFRSVYLYALGELAAGEHHLRLRLTSGDLKLNEFIVTDNPAPFFVDGWQREKN